MVNKGRGQIKAIGIGNLLSCCLLLLGLGVRAAEAPPQEEGLVHGDNVIVYDIAIEGLSRTDRQVVYRELLFQPGQVVSTEDLRESLQRLRNLQIFASVHFKWLEVPGHPFFQRLLIVIKERWTLIPFLKYENKMNEQVLAVGLNDINFMGQVVDVGFHFESLNGEPSFSLSYRDPRFLGRRLQVGGDLGHLIRNRTLFDDQGLPVGAYSVNRQSMRLFVSDEWQTDHFAGIFIELNNLDYSEDFLSEEERQTNSSYAYQLPKNSVVRLIGTSYAFGRLNYDVELIDGKKSALALSLTHPLLGASEEFYVAELTYLQFKALANRANMALRLSTVVTDSTDPEYQLFRGGNDWVRGLLPGQFQGQASAQANIEYRLSILDRPWLIAQGVFFADIGAVADRFETLFTADHQHAGSAGVGVRLLSPRVYKLNARLDYVLLSSFNIENSLSIGFEQFF